MELTDSQLERLDEFRQFADEAIVPGADQWDQQESLPDRVIRDIARKGYLGAILPEHWGGRGMNMVEFGLLNRELGRGCSSVRTLITVHTMVGLTLLRWGSTEQKGSWLGKLARGEVIGAFALTEPNAGSDAGNIETLAEACDEGFSITGRKMWISFAEIADVYLIFAKTAGGASAFLLDRSTPGLTLSPVRGLLGTRASMMAELRLDHCWVSMERMIGSPGVGLSHIAASALDCGRYSVAWGCVGIAEACLESCLQYTSSRKQFGNPLKDYQLVQRIIAEMSVSAKAACLLCWQAGRLRDAGDPSYPIETSVAKYAASKAAARAARDAVQLHGANGCVPGHAVDRFFRDAKLMEIIEGSNEIQEIAIAKSVYGSISHARDEVPVKESPYV